MGLFSSFYKFIINFIAALVLCISTPVFAFQTVIPVTGLAVANPALPAEKNLMPLQDFADAVKDGNAEKIKGLYAADVFSLRVIQQPSGKPGFVSPVEGVATQFGMASGNNVTGMLAHNFASGRYFFDLAQGNTIDVVYGDGSIKEYKVEAIKKFQALSPKSASSDFVDLDTNEKLSAAGLFSKMYTGKHHLTLQTCIQEGTEDSWGRLFVIAEPVEA
jgi:hypothetical protein